MPAISADSTLLLSEQIQAGIVIRRGEPAYKVVSLMAQAIGAVQEKVMRTHKVWFVAFVEFVMVATTALAEEPARKSSTDAELLSILTKSVESISSFEAVYTVSSELMYEGKTSTSSVRYWCSFEPKKGLYTLRELDRKNAPVYRELKVEGGKAFLRDEKDPDKLLNAPFRDVANKLGKVCDNSSLCEEVEAHTILDVSTLTFKGKNPISMLGGKKLLASLTVGGPKWREKVKNDKGKGLVVGKRIRVPQSPPVVINGMKTMLVEGVHGVWVEKHSISSAGGGAKGLDDFMWSSIPTSSTDAAVSMWLVPEVGYLPAKIEVWGDKLGGKQTLQSKCEVYQYLQVKPGVWFPAKGAVITPSVLGRMRGSLDKTAGDVDLVETFDVEHVSLK